MADPKYDEHPIPITPQLLKMILDKEFTGDDDNTMAGGAMKGLSIYLMESMTAEEIKEATEYAQALEEARSATVAEIRKRTTRKAQAPADCSGLLGSQKTYAHLLLALFGRKCPFLQELVRDMIMPLQKFIPHAKALMRRTTLSAIMWATFKQGCSFALGDMPEHEKNRTPEWETAVSMIGSQMDFNLLGVPITLKGVHIVEGWGPKTKTDTGGKRKQQEPKDGGKAQRITDDKGSPKQQKTDAYDGSKIPVHAVIKSKITASLPDQFQMKKLAEACGITDLSQDH